MTFEQRQPQPTILLSSQTSCEQSLSQTLINSSKESLCRICGDIARGINYGALSCPACRAFFRRHGFRSKNIHSCPFKGQCEVHIHKQQRAACMACRLAKCLAVGMNIKFFRRVTQKPQKCNSQAKVTDTRIAQYQSQMFVPQLPTLDLLNHKQSRLTSSHWTLLSNIVHAYDNFSSISEACCIIEQLSKLSISQLSDTPMTIRISGYVLASMISFIRSIPDFQILTITEQRSLLERNLQGCTGFNFTLVMRDSNCIDNSTFITNTASAYGFEAVSRLKHLKNQLDSDPTLVKLMLVIFAFSSNCSILNMPETMPNDTLLLGAFRLLGSQNVYVELLWKYMVYRYGYHATVIRFANLIKQVLDFMDHISKGCLKVKTRYFHLEDFVDRNNRSCISSSNEHVPVWGNT